MSKEAMKLALEAAYLAGWNASGEGYNAEYPFGDHAKNPEEDAAWIKDRDNALREALAEQPAQQEPPAWWPAVESILKEYGLQAIDFVADFKAAIAEQPAQHEPVPCCGKYETCTQACTPRGRFLGKREALANEALDKMAENARELGLDYEPAQQEPVFTYDQVKAHIQAAMMSAAQRTWVGLTDEEREQHRNDWHSNIHDKEFRAIEAKLKERNQ